MKGFWNLMGKFYARVGRYGDKSIFDISFVQDFCHCAHDMMGQRLFANKTTAIPDADDAARIEWRKKAKPERCHC